jgi:hypothetical protein
MKRALLVGLGAISVAIAAVPAIASAADFPPPPPATYYGTVPAGIGSGQAVIAIVIDGQSSAVCGDGVVVPDPQNSNKLSYAVDVAQDAQIPGCGKAGRTVMFFFSGAGIGGGRLATDSASWNGPGGSKKDLTALGPALTVRSYAPTLARDGVN